MDHHFFKYGMSNLDFIEHLAKLPTPVKIATFPSSFIIMVV